MSKRNKNAIGMIGLGLISDVHFATFANHELVYIKALSDLNQPLLLEKAQKYHISETYPDYTYMLKDPSITIVDIMTPHFMHKQCVTDALLAGKNVICEKPVTTTTKDLKSIMALVKKTGLQVYIKQYLRHAKPYQEAKKLLDTGRIGTPYFVQCTFTGDSRRDYLNPHTWRGNIKEAGGGVFIDVGVHILDVLQVLFGNPKTTYGQSRKITSQLPQKGEDFASIMLEFPRNIVGVISCTQTDTGYRFRWEVRIYGTEGVMTIIDEGKEEKILRIYKDNVCTFEYKEEDWWTNSNIRALNEIAFQIHTLTPPTVSLKDSYEVLDTILNSYKSFKTHKPVLIR